MIKKYFAASGNEYFSSTRSTAPTTEMPSSVATNLPAESVSELLNSAREVYVQTKPSITVKKYKIK